MTCVRAVKLASVLFMFVLIVVVNGVVATDFCERVVKPFGYGCAEYTIQTADGFLLAMHRLSRINSLEERGRAWSPAAPAPVQGGPIVSEYPEGSGPSPVQGSPVVSQYPEATGPSPVQGDSTVPQYAETSGPSASWMLKPSDDNILRSNDSRLLLEISSSGLLAHFTPHSPLLEVFGNRDTKARSTNARHSNSANATHKGRRPHHRRPGTPISSVSSNSTSAAHKGKRPHPLPLGGSSPGTPIPSVSSNRTSATPKGRRPHPRPPGGSSPGAPIPSVSSNRTSATPKGRRPHPRPPGGSSPGAPTLSVSSNRTSATPKRKRPHHRPPGRPSPGAPIPSVSSNRTSSNNPVVMAGPAPTSTQNASSSSTHTQRQSANCTSNYTANQLAGKGSPVLLMHQEFVNGDIWFEFVDAADNCSRSLLPFMLLNDGFDVWIGHQRATLWSHGHVQLNSTDREYWDWTWDQHVQYDLSIQLLFISTETDQPVHFIGSSQAATVGIAAATDHEVAQMIRSLTLIGPTAYRGYSNSLLLEAWAYNFGLTIDSEYYNTGFQNGAFNYSTEFPQTGPFSARGLTNAAISLISGPNCCLDSAAPIQITNGWDGTTSFKNLLHWQQGIRMNSFAHYDYGNPARNMQAYGQAIPPAYDVGGISRRLPILIVAGGRDWFAPPQGIRLLLSQLQAAFINLTNYAHYDLFLSVRRQADIYLPILEFLGGPQFQ